MKNKLIDLNDRGGMTTKWAAVIESELAKADLSIVRRADMASRFGVHDMTLARRLMREGVLWGDLLDAERKRRCERTLRANSRACARRIMGRCGIGRQHLHNSIRRWYGVTLTELRGNLSILDFEARA